MITCQELADFIADYVAGELPPEELAAFEEHLAVCPPCIRYLESYRRTIELAREAYLGAGDARSASGARRPPPPPSMPEELIRAILASRKKPGPDPD